MKCKTVVKNANFKTYTTYTRVKNEGLKKVIVITVGNSRNYTIYSIFKVYNRSTKLYNG